MKLMGRVNIEFCSKIGKSASKMVKLMCHMYGNECLPHALLHSVTRFKDSWKDLEDDKRPRHLILVHKRNNNCITAFVSRKLG